MSAYPHQSASHRWVKLSHIFPVSFKRCLCKCRRLERSGWNFTASVQFSRKAVQTHHQPSNTAYLPTTFPIIRAFVTCRVRFRKKVFESQKARRCIVRRIGTVSVVSSCLRYCACVWCPVGIRKVADNGEIPSTRKRAVKLSKTFPYLARCRRYRRTELKVWRFFYTFYAFHQHRPASIMYYNGKDVIVI